MEVSEFWSRFIIDYVFWFSEEEVFFFPIILYFLFWWLDCWRTFLRCVSWFLLKQFPFETKLFVLGSLLWMVFLGEVFSSVCCFGDFFGLWIGVVLCLIKTKSCGGFLCIFFEGCGLWFMVGLWFYMGGQWVLDFFFWRFLIRRQQIYFEIYLGC